MKAIAVINGNLHDVELPVPQPQGRDLVVKVEAISVNPVDFKQRKAAAHDGEPRLVGWDVAGTVSAVGPQATLFKVGDAVYYAGSVVRPGANSEFHAVDERIVGRKPASLSVEHAAALPLTSITAWEALFERLGVSRSGADQGKSVLIIGGAGGVGSIAIQLAKKLAKLKVIATASRRASEQWCRALGADHVIDHLGDMPAQLAALGLAEVDYILCLNDIDAHFAAMAAAIAPQGKICAIVRNERPLPMDLVFAKSVTVAFEMMFTRSMFGTADMIEQHKLLNEVAALVDAGVLTTTVGENGGRIDAANLTRAHAALEAGRTIGKIVLAGF
ncbi:zinc-binding alcohol dehydrogenase family protein [Massilia sp. DJPM01]|uniref:zinc-binding alcohol dehydrogenase family protein n=1 Tax=Massilia sp. DJPM01 TaxID=3024404 RepID=UPI00259EB32F|nr:zinc-binding alcohol dehydrogenase family protein [Massilia sp. DJPM01]MDM5181260.1 zinc-binding alcohol dehydrogenase family protein [Massilia sp. DJPM01]